MNDDFYKIYAFENCKLIIQMKEKNGLIVSPPETAEIVKIDKFTMLKINQTTHYTLIPLNSIIKIIVLEGKKNE
ncbi:MAG: hypothetical protein QXE51_03275 [Nitrososphaeria archaeon]